MKAIYFEEHGSADVLQFGELPDPVPRTGEALIRVEAVALNHLDIWVRRGWPGLKLSLPHVGGSDICGKLLAACGDCPIAGGSRVVVNPGLRGPEDEWLRKGCDSVSPGYRILGEQVPGGMAELVCVPIDNLLEAPDEWSAEEAAAPLLVGLTAWRMLFHRAALKAGEHILIVGAGGGVNSLSIALSRAAGARVIALSSSPAKLKLAAELGAEHTIDYRKRPDWHKEVLRLTEGRGVDVVVDNVGAATFNMSLKAAARGGRIITVGNTSGHLLSIDNRLIFTKQLAILGSTMGSKQDFIEMLAFMRTQGIRPVIHSATPLSGGIGQLRLLEKGSQFGKLILTP